MQAGSRKNMDRMAEVVPDASSRNLQQFLTHSKWDAVSVIDHVARDVDELLGDEQRAGLIIDESGFAKQGQDSVGVSRQWLGRLGKVDNGQVAVFGALANDRFAAPVDVRLYLPEKWTKDCARCKKAGIPEDKRQFKTKEQLAIEVVRHARENKLRFGWVGADAGYGKGPGFCAALEQMGEHFVVDVHLDLNVYLQDPAPYVPTKISSRGRQPQKYVSKIKGHTVEEVINGLAFDQMPVLKLRNTTRGPLKVHAVQMPVYIWDGKGAEVKRWTLVVTQTLGTNADTKASFCNFADIIDLEAKAWMQRQRYWVERTFEDAKSECGMADYQVRKWSAWHHHMALVVMTMLFMLSEKVRHKDTMPLLSCSDIEQLLCHFLPRRDFSEDEVIRQLQYRHKKRQAAIMSHSKKTNAQNQLPPE